MTAADEWLLRTRWEQVHEALAEVLTLAGSAFLAVSTGALDGVGDELLELCEVAEEALYRTREVLTGRTGE